MQKSATTSCVLPVSAEATAAPGVQLVTPNAPSSTSAGAPPTSTLVAMEVGATRFSWAQISVDVKVRSAGIARSVSCGAVKFWVIRDEQMRAFEKALRAGFVRSAMVHLREHFESARGMKADELRALVEQVILQAEGFGIVAERDVIKLLGVRVALGPDYAKRDWARRILESAAGPSLRANRLAARAESEFKGSK
jgi:hypothetical protein